MSSTFIEEELRSIQSRGRETLNIIIVPRVARNTRLAVTRYKLLVLTDSKAITHGSAKLADFHSEHLTHDYAYIIQKSIRTVVYVMNVFTSFSAASRTVRAGEDHSGSGYCWYFAYDWPSQAIVMRFATCAHDV